MSHGTKSCIQFSMVAAAVALAGCGTPTIESNAPALDYKSEVECRDGLDNDGDGLIDCQDPDCQRTNACECRQVGPVLCCYPVCDPLEQLQCLGDHICGYPCSCVPRCGPCISNNDCPYGQVCNAPKLCLSWCSCPQCDVCAGFCVNP